MNKENIILIGGGGHCLSCIDVIEQEGKYNILGIVDPNLERGSVVYAYPVLGGDDVLEEIKLQCNKAILTVGQIKSGMLREKLAKQLEAMGFEFPVIVSPLAHVSKRAKLESGTVVLHGAVVNAGAEIGMHTIVNTNATVEHGCKTGAFSHLSTGCLVNGDCVLGAGVFIGSGAVLVQGTEVADETVVGAGAVVLTSIKEKGIYVGNPAKIKHG